MAPPPRPGWFQRLCRQSGLLVHQIAKPVERPRAGPRVVVRRTTVVEEVELPADHPPAHDAPPRREPGVEGRA